MPYSTCNIMEHVFLVRFEAVMEVSIKFTNFWDVTEKSMTHC
jgi:hypothetical protein